MTSTEEISLAPTHIRPKVGAIGYLWGCLHHGPQSRPLLL